MKKKFIWTAVSCLMVLSLVLASCAPAVEEEEVVEEEVEMMTDLLGRRVEKPKYGE